MPALTVPAVLDRSSGAWTAIALIVPSFVPSRVVAGSSGVHRIVRIRARRAPAIFPRPFGSPEHFSPQGPSAIGGPMSVRWRIADIISPRRPFPALAALVVAVALLGCDCGKMDASSWFQSASVGDAVPVSVRFTLSEWARSSTLCSMAMTLTVTLRTKTRSKSSSQASPLPRSQRYGIERHRARD